MPEDVREVFLQTIEDSLQAQLTAVRRLRKAAGQRSPGGAGRAKGKRRSQVSMVYDILEAAGRPLHISEIIATALKRFHRKLDRESLVSALTKRLSREDRFVRTEPNTFALRSLKLSGKEE